MRCGRPGPPGGGAIQRRLEPRGDEGPFEGGRAPPGAGATVGGPSEGGGRRKRATRRTRRSGPASLIVLDFLPRRWLFLGSSGWIAPTARLFNDLKLLWDFVPLGRQPIFSAEALGSRRCALQPRLPRGSGAATACPRVGKWEHLPTAPERQGRMGVRRARPRSPPSGRRTPRRVIQMQREGNQAEIPPQKNWLRPTAGP